MLIYLYKFLRRNLYLILGCCLLPIAAAQFINLPKNDLLMDVLYVMPIVLIIAVTLAIVVQKAILDGRARQKTKATTP